MPSWEVQGPDREVFTQNLIILDALCNDKYHLPEDDRFYTELFSNDFTQIRLISSPKVVSGLREAGLGGNVTFEETRLHSPKYSGIHEGFLYVYRMLFCGKLDTNSLIFLPAFSETALILFKFLRAYNIPVYAILHNNLGAVKGQGIKRRIKKYLLLKAVRCLDGLFVFTDYAKAEVMQILPGIDETKIHVIPLYMAGAERAALKERNFTRLLFMGVGTSEKRLTKLWELMSSCSLRKYDFVVRGEILLDQNAAELIQTNSDRLSLKQVYMTKAEFYEAMYNCSFLVLPYEKSYQGKLSGMFCEAISTGTPVIAPNYPPFTTYFKKFGDLGILVDFESPDWILDLSRKLEAFENTRYVSYFERARLFHSRSAVRERMLHAFQLTGKRVPCS